MTQPHPDSSGAAGELASPSTRFNLSKWALDHPALTRYLLLVLMILAYGFPIAQFVIEPSPAAIVHRVR